MNVTFHKPAEIADSLLKYAVIAARYQEKWVFCRHKQRSTWEIPGGHREPGEAIEETAHRELYEETGALNAEIRPICVYGATKFGMLFFADIKTLGSLPKESEIGEIRLADSLPEELTYPHIQPYLYTKVQGWLNLQSSADEIWDEYNENRNLTGRTHRRGDPLEPGAYHLVVHVWMRNREGKFLLTKRSPNKGFPNMWETTGGSALSGDDSLTAALREVREETGLMLDPSMGKTVISKKGEDYFLDVWLFCQDFALEDVVLQPGETCGKMYATKEEILKLYKAGEFVPYDDLEQLLQRLTDAV